MRIANRSQQNLRGCLTILAVVILSVLSYAPAAYSQAITKFDRERRIAMLKSIKDDIKKNYYDENYHGIDLDARFKAAEEKMKEAQSIGQTFGIIAQALLEFNDSHTFFTPPQRANRTDYGWQI